MSIARLTAALASGSAELTLALANLNFDVSLIKMEAPSEYRPVETALSKRTKTAAEDGEIQACARKLQALFSPILPQVPNLQRAYGSRASEIATDSRNEVSEKISVGPFADHVGIDGGSLWAAANSGQGAVAVHLLGCMLARMFTAIEATSIWEEIVNFRKDEILRRESSGDTDPRNVFTVLAAKTPLTRQHLETWDASARAWLRVADEAMKTKQTQLLLVTNNINLSVNRHSTTYADVTQAWIRAMVAVDKLVEGMPHSIVDGAVLVAISAWHLYPDMMVLGKKNTLIKQTDTFVKPGGILTLGLETIPIGEGALQGVSWSLPLACYYFYGKPITAEQSLIETGSRLNIQQLLVVALGSIFSHWTEQQFEPTKAARLVRSLWALVNRPSRLKIGTKPSSKSWLALLAKAAESLLDSKNVILQELRSLFKYGQRNCAGFLGLESGQSSPFVRLQEPQIMLPMIIHPGSHIKLLRMVSKRLDIEPTRLIIRYALPGLPGKIRFGYATIPSTMTKDKAQELHRWENASSGIPENDEKVHKLAEEDIVRPPSGVGDKDRRFFWREAPLELSPDGYINVTIDDFFGRFAEFAMFSGQADPKNPRRLKGVPCNLIFGDPSTAAIYQTYEPSRNVPSLFLADELEPLFIEGEVNLSLLLLHLTDNGSTSQEKLSDHVRALQAIATIGMIYDDFPKATIAKEFVRTSPQTALWLSGSLSSGKEPLFANPSKQHDTEQNGGFEQDLPAKALEPVCLTRRATFACIAMLESGSVNIGPDGLEAVMAMSSGDSLYVATELVHDPAHQSQSPITRIRGNIGRPGITMLIPPSRTLQWSEAQDWKLIEHASFDAQKKDCFKSTSLHLSFTEYSLAIDTGRRGVRSSEIQLLETIMSVHDKGRWIADIDILSALASPLLRRAYDGPACHHNDSESPGSCLVSLDSWDEFLDRPREDSVFRAHLNWQARLAASALSVARGDLTIVFNTQMCWACGQSERRRLGHKSKATYII